MSHGKLSGKYLASCYGKIRYDSYSEAADAGNKISSNIGAYRCRFTDNGVHYHKGRKPWR
jgi:hypothetical protein